MSSPRRYEFGERLAMSQGVSGNTSIEAILLEAIPGALSARPAHKKNDRHGVDWWVECDGRHLAVDVKARGEDWASKPRPYTADDLALETWSVIERNVVGWTRDESKRTDYVLWFWQDTRRWCLIPFPFLCRVFSERWQEWHAAYEHHKQHTPRADGGYHSECVYVPRRVVWASIYERFSGVPVH